MGFQAGTSGPEGRSIGFSEPGKWLTPHPVVDVNECVRGEEWAKMGRIGECRSGDHGTTVMQSRQNKYRGNILRITRFLDRRGCERE